jgi:AcrR family transcriptional regulator
MSDSDKKPYHHGDLRESLLKAAEAALGELPLEKVTLREIARRAGVSHAAPKHHFGTLGALMGEIAASGFERFVEELRSSANRSADQTPTARLQAMSRAYLRFAAQNRAAYGLMFGQKVGVERTPRAAAASFAAWSELETAVAAIVGKANAVHGAVMVWSSVHGLAMLVADRSLPPQVDPQVAVDQVSRLVIQGLKAERDGI